MDRKVVFADALRGIAALCVVCSHYFGVFWVSGPALPLIANVPQLPAGAPPAIAAQLIQLSAHLNLGPFGVGLFFLISGFVIPRSLDRLSVADFLYARGWRIVPTYAVGFACTVAALAFASAYFSRPFPYPAWMVALHAVAGLRAIAGIPPIDYVVWTLEIEIAFYLVCAMLAGWMRRRSLLVLLGPTLALLLAGPYGTALGISPVQPIALDFMFVGVVISFHHGGSLRSPAAVAAATFAAATSLLSAWLALGAPIATNYAMALAVFAGCYLARSVFPDLWLLRKLSAISYPLYVVHGVAGYVTMRTALACGAPPTIAITAALALSIGMSVALHLFVEQPTQQIGKQGLPRLGTPSAAQAGC